MPWDCSKASWTTSLNPTPSLGALQHLGSASALQVSKPKGRCALIPNPDSSWIPAIRQAGLSAITHPSVGSSSSFFVHLIWGGGDPAATQGNTALCPGSRVRDRGGLSSARLCGSASANTTGHSWHQRQNQKMVMLKTTKTQTAKENRKLNL